MIMTKNCHHHRTHPSMMINKFCVRNRFLVYTKFICDTGKSRGIRQPSRFEVHFSWILLICMCFQWISLVGNASIFEIFRAGCLCQGDLIHHWKKKRSFYRKFSDLYVIRESHSEKMSLKREQYHTADDKVIATCYQFVKHFVRIFYSFHLQCFVGIVSFVIVFLYKCSKSMCVACDFYTICWSKSQTHP